MTRPLFNPRTDPNYSHQAEYNPLIRELSAAALFWRTGTGKTRSDLEDTAYLYCNNRIDAQVVIAPIDVHRRTWVEQQGPRWLQVPGAKILGYTSKSQAGADDWRDLTALQDHDGLKILVMYFEALASKSGYEFFRTFLANAGRIKITVDESHRIMTPGSLASTRLAKCRDMSVVRRIMTATPTGNGIEDLYSQFRFLDGEKVFDVSTFAEYKGLFLHEVKVPGSHHQKVVGYRNIKYLNKRMAPYVFVAKKPEGLPPQFWVNVPTTLSDEQWKAYKEMKRDYQTQLSTGHWVDAELSIVRLKRLQQIVAGHLPVPSESDERKNRQIIPLECPRIQTTIDVVRGCPEKVILWAQEHYEIERLHRELNEQGVKSLMYYGKVKKGIARDSVLDQFEDDPEIKCLVANDAVGGTGLTIVGRVAPVSDQVFYSHTWSRLLREQCEGRNHRGGTKAESCGYHNIVAHGTTDVRILHRRQQKDDIAKLVADPREIAKLLDDDLDYMVDGTVPNI